MINPRAILDEVAQRLANPRLPEATYRLQMHKRFTFRDAAAIVPYLHELGITHCYASPYLKARPGSEHGYDIVDHRQLNLEIGAEDDYRAWVEELTRNGMSHILDMVPNHMGITGNENLWWNDVLENGPSSQYADYFDIAWQSSHRPELRGRVLLPLLGAPYGQVLESGEIRLEYGAGAFQLSYWDNRFPVAPGTYATILRHRLNELEQRLAPDDPAFVEYQSILTAINNLPGRSETKPARRAERNREKEVIKRRLATLTESSRPILTFIEETVKEFNGTPGDSRSFDLLDNLLAAQPYRLSYWRVAADEINYRRFFDVNQLAAVSVERPEVFAATHELVLKLLREGAITGLRIDHPDGLYDPRQYLDRLQEHYLLACARAVFEADPETAGRDWKEVEESVQKEMAKIRKDRDSPLWRPLYVVVEKILGPAELLREDWPTHGTTGYDFLNLANGLFVDTGNATAFTRLYQNWIGDETSFSEHVYRNKFLIMRVTLSSELHMLAYQLDRLAQQDRWSCDFTLHSLRHALREVIACFPVYRSYINGGEPTDGDRKSVQLAISRARRKNPAISRSLFEYLRDVLLLQAPHLDSKEYRADQEQFVGKFQQVTSPVMAKGMEDTAFYVYNRLVSLNEVGGAPDRFGVSPPALHRALQERQVLSPYGLSVLSTHDTKRSEDVRARINVLSEMPDEWQQQLALWSRLNAEQRVTADGEPAPGPNEEYLLYQTLLGAWPVEPCSEEEYKGFVERIKQYMTKALAEAKVHTSWINPDATYEDAVRTFIDRILTGEGGRAFREAFRPFQRRISHYGMLNSLAQTLLRITAPGVPDTYQGTELWDFSLVDPDNRRPVDYDIRRRLLAELGREREARPDRAAFARELVERKEDGRVKLYLTAAGLRCRREHPGLFSAGEYIPLPIEGEKQAHAFGFARRHGGRTALVVVPRLLTGLAPAEADKETRRPGDKETRREEGAVSLAPGLPVSLSPCLPLGPGVWGDTWIALPEGAPERYRNALTGEVLTATPRGGQSALGLGELFASFPVVLLLDESNPA